VSAAWCEWNFASHLQTSPIKPHRAFLTLAERCAQVLAPIFVQCARRNRRLGLLTTLRSDQGLLVQIASRRRGPKSRIVGSALAVSEWSATRKLQLDPFEIRDCPKRVPRQEDDRAFGSMQLTDPDAVQGFLELRIAGRDSSKYGQRGGGQIASY